MQGRACTLFVPMAEEGLMGGPIVEGIARHYLEDIFNSAAAFPRPDTLLLGCTHFPLFRDSLQKIVGPGVCIVNPAATVAETVELELAGRDLLRHAERAAKRHFMTTDNRERFARTGSLFLGSPLAADAVELVDL